MKKLKVIYLFIFIIVLGILILPQFNLKIGDTEFKFPDINLRLINESATLGNFNKGHDLYDAKIYTALVNFSEEENADSKEQSLKSLVAIIEKRIEYSNVSDINVFGSSDAEGYKINLKFPEYIEESDKIANYLLGQGIISFENDPQVTETAVSLSDTDITGQIKSIYDETYGNVLSFKFKDTALTNLYFAFQNENNYFLMRVDSTYFAVIQDPNYTNTQSSDLATSVIAVPFADLKLSPNVALYTNIVRSYFLNAPLENSLTFNANPTVVKRNFVADKIAYIAIFIIIAVALITLLYLGNKNKQDKVRFILMVLSYLIFSTFILKFQSATLSVSLIMGYVLGLVVLFYVLEKLFLIEEDQQGQFLTSILHYGLFISLLVYVLYRFIQFNSYLVDALGALLASMLALMFLCIFNYKYILDTEFNLKIFRKRL